MPVHQDVPWTIVEHTSAKHDIYRRYLGRWFPILLGGQNAYPSGTYAEGFAGPGVYRDGEPGSPIIALRTFLAEVVRAEKYVRATHGRRRVAGSRPA